MAQKSWPNGSKLCVVCQISFIAYIIYIRHTAPHKLKWRLKSLTYVYVRDWAINSSLIVNIYLISSTAEQSKSLINLANGVWVGNNCFEHATRHLIHRRTDTFPSGCQ